MDIIAKLLIITFTLHETFIFASSANITTVVLQTLFNKQKRKKEKKEENADVDALTLSEH